MATKKNGRSASGHGVWQVENRQRNVRVSLRTARRFLRRVIRELGVGRDSVALCFVSDQEMARLNETYRKKKGTTDVLSFPAEERGKPVNLAKRVRELRGEFLGDIAISPAVARRNARLLGRSLSGEIHALILHGVLHLLGYDHETDRGEMRRVEAMLQCRLGLR